MATRTATPNVATENATRKGVAIPMGNAEALITLTFTPKQLEELAEALASHEKSWSVVPNTPEGRRSIFWAKKDFIEDGRYVYVGGKAKAYYRTAGKVATFNKHSRIASLREKLAEALKLV